MGGGLSTSFGFQNTIEGKKNIPVSPKNFRLSLREISYSFVKRNKRDSGEAEPWEPL